MGLDVYARFLFGVAVQRSDFWQPKPIGIRTACPSGHTRPDGAAFCPRCGVRFDDQATADEPTERLSALAGYLGVTPSNAWARFYDDLQDGHVGVHIQGDPCAEEPTLCFGYAFASMNVLEPSTSNPGRDCLPVGLLVTAGTRLRPLLEAAGLADRPLAVFLSVEVSA